MFQTSNPVSLRISNDVHLNLFRISSFEFWISTQAAGVAAPRLAARASNWSAFITFEM